MSYQISTTDEQVFTALRSWILGCVVLNECVQGFPNRVPMPKDDLVVMSPISRTRLALNTTAYPTGLTQTNTISLDYAIQIDCYGPNAADHASVLHDSWYSEQAYQRLIVAGLSPLWADEPKSIPLLNSEQQYEQRWTMQLHLQFKPSISDPQQSATTVTVNPADVISVDARYQG